MADFESSLQQLPSTSQADASGVGDARTYEFEPSTWCRSWGKRIFDVFCAGCTLLALAPLMLLIIMVIRVASPGPAIFRQRRVGRNGKYFQLLKFRSMAYGNEGGPELTCSSDPRITRVGRILRKWKLDEIPQLFNVVAGDMSLVGPRPHVPELLGPESPLQSFMLSLRPGITGLASVRFRKEEEMLPAGSSEQLRALYLQKILPTKISYELQYARTASFFSDFGILIRTVSAVLFPPEPAGDVVAAESLEPATPLSTIAPKASSAASDLGEAA